MNAYGYQGMLVCEKCASILGQIDAEGDRSDERAARDYPFFMACSHCGQDAFGRDVATLQPRWAALMSLKADWVGPANFLTQIAEVTYALDAAADLQRRGLPRFSVEFHGFTSGWGYVRYEQAGVMQEELFRSWAALRAILRTIKLPKGVNDESAQTA